MSAALLNSSCAIKQIYSIATILDILFPYRRYTCTNIVLYHKQNDMICHLLYLVMSFSYNFIKKWNVIERGNKVWFMMFYIRFALDWKLCSNLWQMHLPNHHRTSSDNQFCAFSLLQGVLIQQGVMTLHMCTNFFPI